MRRSLLLTAMACLVLTMSASAANGLNYTYYEGNWSTMPDFSSINAAKGGATSNLDLGIRGRDTYFSILWQGYIVVPADGTYTFELTSDDGSKMYLGNYNNSSTAFINNDGLHGSKTLTASRYLYKGVFPIAISYFQGSGVNLMELYWSSTSGISRQKVPDNSFLTNYNTTVNNFSGLNYSYVEGSFNALPDFFSQSKAKTGNSSNIDLGVRKQNTLYAMLWEGYITVPTDAIYTFETNSDDGSKVYLGIYNNGLSPLVNNDGNHGLQVRKGSIFLTAGVYPIAVSYYQNTGDGIMELYWSSNMGLARQQVPDNAFKSTATAGKSSGSSGNISYKYFEGSFTSLPDLSAVTPKESGTSSNFDLGVRSRNEQYAMMWQANITVPTTGTYTFETVSDDGSKLYLGNYGSTVTPLINNDGPHGVQSRSASQYLNAGSYTLTVQYFQGTGDQSLEVYWSSTTGIARQRIPDDALTAYTGTNVAVGTTTNPTPPSNPAPPPLPPTPDLSTGANESGGLTGGTNYYFSSSTGDDSRTAAQAQNQSTPWRSLDKLNALIPYLGANDAVLLKRGDVFTGSITIKRTSNQYSGIIISSYGTGNKPVINGFATLGSWVNSGNGIWSSYYNYTGSRINMVTMNGTAKEMGRYPNADAAVKGYLTYDSHTFDGGSWTGSITDNEYSNKSSVNWTGGELALRKKRWVVDQCPITYQSGNTFYYKSTSFYPGIDGFGYFIQNHPKTLDQLGEWYFDPNSKYLQMYFGSSNPSNYEIKESVVDVLINILGQGNITIDNLTLQGANSKAISVGSSGNIKISNCNVLYSGVNAIDVNYTNALTIENSLVSDTHNDALYLGPSVNNSVVRNNKVVNTGIYAGMGANSDNARTAIIIAGTTNSVEYNEVYNTGYNGIKFHGNNITVKNNLVNMFNFNSDDGGGIYTYDGGMYGRKILNNVVVNGPGASDGTNSYLDYAANGIDLDDLSNDVEITGNSVANCNGRGLCNHNSHELVINGNTVYNCDMSQVEFDHDLLGPNDPIRNVNMTNNIFVAKTVEQPVLIVRTKNNDVAQMGGMDNNIYARPIDDNQTFSTFTYFNTPSVIPKTFDLAHWKSSFGYDARSGKSPVRLSPYTVNSASGNLYTTNSTFDAGIRNVLTPTSDRTSLQFDNSVLDGGALKVSFTGNAGAQYQAIWFWDAVTVPTLLPNRTYRVKFTVKGNVDNNTDFFGTLISAYGTGKTDAKLFKISNNRSEVELFFTPTTALVSPYFQIHEPLSTECPTFWIDNMNIQEVYSISYTNPDDYLRFEYNGTTSSKSIGLDGTYVDMKNNTYNNSITLAPYTAAVLVRKGSSLVQETQKILSEGTTAARMITTAEEAATTDNLVSSSELKLTPNPAVDRIQLNLKTVQGAGNATLKIFSASGTVVNNRQLIVSGQPVTVDVSALAKGVYTVQIVYGGRTISKKFVKM